MTISRWILVRVRHVLDKFVLKIKTHVLCWIIFFRKSRGLRDDVEKCGGARGATDDVTIWRIRVACWVSKATCTHSHRQIVILTAFPWHNDSWTRLNVALCVQSVLPTLEHHHKRRITRKNQPNISVSIRHRITWLRHWISHLPSQSLPIHRLRRPNVYNVWCCVYNYTYSNFYALYYITGHVVSTF